jgi:threonylcarbamoyladenosine tRNA methylthiotransferase MtaB
MKELFAERVEKIRELIPLAGIGADVIVGFPGETESDFEDTYGFLEQISLSYLHIFSYSERPGTLAESLPLKVSPAEKDIRSKRLSQLSEIKTQAFCTKNIGREALVLFEKSSPRGMVQGFTDNYIRVEHPDTGSLQGEIRKVIIKDFAESGNMNIELI